jgi:hypothetical protein
MVTAGTEEMLEAEASMESIVGSCLACLRLDR